MSSFWASKTDDVQEEEIRRSEYRKLLRGVGIEIEGQDVCHIISESNGGANARANFFMCSAAFNRRIGNKGDALNCYLVGLDRCKAAVSASRTMSGYQGPTAEDLFQVGSESFGKIASQVLQAPTSTKPRTPVTNQPPQLSQIHQPEQSFFESLLQTITDSVSCPSIIQSGPKKGNRCGRSRPCPYHEKSNSKSVPYTD